jgi:hypothetical protein
MTIDKWISDAVVCFPAPWRRRPTSGWAAQHHVADHAPIHHEATRGGLILHPRDNES